jgi:hypothetical protein
MDVTIDISEIKVLETFFDNLSTMDQKKIFTAAYRKAARPLVTAVKNAAPYRRGIVRKSIGTVEIPDRVAILVGARLAGANKGWAARFTEGGTAERTRKKGGSTGKVTATHWFENTYNMMEDQVYDTIANEWYNEIDKYIAKVNKK